MQTERWRFPGETMLHETAARLLLHAEQPLEAVNELTTALLADPENLRLQARLAEAHMAAGQFAQAATLWGKLIGQAKDVDERRQQRLQLAECQVRSRQYDDAAHTYRVLVLTDGDDMAALLGLAATTLVAGRPQETVEAAQRALHIEPTNTDALLALACGYARLDQTAKAIETLALSDAPANDDPLVRELLAQWRRK